MGFRILWGTEDNSMPRLILFAPCENLIISSGNQVSLISVLEGITLALPETLGIPTGATVPMRWFVLMTWEREPTDDGKEYECYVEAAHIRSQILRFRLVTPLHRVVVQLMGFPLIFGGLRLRAFMHEVGGGDFVVVGDYPLEVHRLRAPEPQTLKISN